MLISFRKLKREYLDKNACKIFVSCSEEIFDLKWITLSDSGPIWAIFPFLPSPEHFPIVNILQLAVIIVAELRTLSGDIREPTIKISANLKEISLLILKKKNSLFKQRNLGWVVATMGANFHTLFSWRPYMNFGFNPTRLRDLNIWKCWDFFFFFFE